MILKELTIRNFRNIKDTVIPLSDNINVIYGLNGEGKTNIMEAIGFLGLCKSFRNQQDKSLIHFDENHFYLKGKIESENGDFELETSFDGEMKKKKKNSIEIPKVKDYIGNLRTVIFSVEDLNIIKGTPQYKRSFLDQTISQTNYVFLDNAITYKKLMLTKNALLKNEHIDQIYLETINEEMKKCMLVIQRERANLIDFINVNINGIYQHLSGKEEDNVYVEYKTNFNQDTDLNKYFELEKRRNSCVIGIHRDDLVINLNRKNIEDFGSQGQQRLLVICLKILQLMYLKEKTNSIPILLLDDVFSEIDNDKIIRILQYIVKEDYQVIITTTEKIVELEHLDNINYLYIEDLTNTIKDTPQ